MARLLYITNGMHGGLNASFEFARRMVVHGHEMAFLGHRDLADRMALAGYAYHRVSDADETMESLRDEVNRVGRLRSIRRSIQLRKQLLQSTEIESTVTDLDPDALIIDYEAHTAVLATHSLGIPTVLKSDFFSMAHQPGIPPLQSEQDHPSSRRDRIAAEATWARAYASRYVQQSIGELQPTRLMRRIAPFRYNTVWRSDLRAVAKARGLKIREISSTRGWLWPHMYPDLPVVSSTARELDFVTQTTPNDRWVGPLVDRERIETAIPADDVKRWHDFRDRNRHAGRPLIYCSFGTMLPDTHAMVERVIAAVRSRGDWDLVVGLGSRNQQHSAGSDDENVLVLDHAPQIEVLTHAHAAVIHGGINTINECLLFGVPVLCESTGPFDGPGNASRVEHHGVGLRTHLLDCSQATLTEMIDTLLTDEALASRVNQMRRHFERYQHDQVLETLIDDLLAGNLASCDCP